MEVKNFYTNNEIRVIISECKNFNELNKTLELMHELYRQGAVFSPRAVQAYSFLFYMDIPFKNEQLN